jgi:nucleoside-diphosphate-sugar epimerase
MKTALVLGAGGFIGSHLVKRLKEEGYWVRGVDLKAPSFSHSLADEFFKDDLRDPNIVSQVFWSPDQTHKNGPNPFDEVYQLAADMGGAGYIFTGEHDAEIMHNSALININVAKMASDNKVGKLFYSSSACMYPERNQMNPSNPNCSEDSAYPAQPDSEYGWEKLFSERLYLAYQRNKGLDVRIARFHNIYGPEGSWNDGREKAPAAICRKVAQAPAGGTIDIWGDGNQTRSFLYIDECLEGIRSLMEAPHSFQPLNIGSEEMVTINQLVQMVASITGKQIFMNHIDGPLGVRGRCSDNKLISELLNWEPDYSLQKGLEITYHWIYSQLYGK